MKAFLQTSVLVATFYGDHQHHQQSLDLFLRHGKTNALLRGINVGGHNKIPMAKLRNLCAGLGGRDVNTDIQNGNCRAGHRRMLPSASNSTMTRDWAGRPASSRTRLGLVT